MAEDRDDRIELEKLEQDERVERLRELLEKGTAKRPEGFRPHFPASGDKGWISLD